MECTTRRTGSSRAWAATAGGRPVAAALRPSARMVSSSVARSVAVGTACHVPTPARTASLYRPMEACVECATPATRPRRAWEGTAPDRTGVATLWPLPRVLTSLAARSVWHTAALVRYTHPDTHYIPFCTRRWSVDGKCATRPMHPPSAWDAEACGRPAVAPSHPPPHVVTSPVARSVVFDRALATYPHQYALYLSA